jgi:hypothetical protein
MGDVGLVDDFDDGDGNILMNDGRSGGWWLWAASTAMTTPPANAVPVPELGGIGAPEDAGAPDARVRDAGRDTRRAPDARVVAEAGAPAEDAGAVDSGIVPGPHVMHIKGSDVAGGNGVALDATTVPVGLCYDATKYTGVSVWVKGKVDPNVTVWVTVRTALVANSGGNSGPNRLPMTIPADWKQIKIPFTDLAPGWGAPVTFDPAQVIGLGIAIGAAPAPAPDGGADPDAGISMANFDLYFDNFAFY